MPALVQLSKRVSKSRHAMRRWRWRWRCFRGFLPPGHTRVRTPPACPGSTKGAGKYSGSTAVFESTIAGEYEYYVRYVLLVSISKSTANDRSNGLCAVRCTAPCSLLFALCSLLLLFSARRLCTRPGHLTSRRPGLPRCSCPSPLVAVTQSQLNGQDSHTSWRACQAVFVLARS